MKIKKFLKKLKWLVTCKDACKFFVYLKALEYNKK